jgi:hypothetical protein
MADAMEGEICVVVEEALAIGCQDAEFLAYLKIGTERPQSLERRDSATSLK